MDMSEKIVGILRIHDNPAVLYAADLIESLQAQNRALAERVAAQHEVLARRAEKTDDPNLDFTDAAHPAFWRGCDYGVQGAAIRLRRTWEGHDDGKGVLGNVWLEKLRREMLARLGEKPLVWTTGSKPAASGLRIKNG